MSWQTHTFFVTLTPPQSTILLSGEMTCRHLSFCYWKAVSSQKHPLIHMLIKKAFYKFVYINYSNTWNASYTTICQRSCGKSSRNSTSITVLCIYHVLYCPYNFIINTPFPSFQGHSALQFSIIFKTLYCPIHLPPRCLLCHHPQHDGWT